MATIDKGMTPARPTSDDVRRLCLHEALGSVSLYMALPEERTTVNAYRARLRQLSRAAEEQTALAQSALSKVKALEEFAREPNFWIADALGLALFASPDEMDVFHVDHPVDDLATVGNRYHCKPLLEHLASDLQCVVVVLSVDGAQLYRVDRSGVKMLFEHDLPDKISPEKRIPGVQFRTQQNAGKAKTALFHGHGAGTDLKKDEVAKRVRALDEWVCDRLESVKAMPVILGGVTYLTSAFRNVTKCPMIIEETIDGGRLTEHEIAARARDIMIGTADEELERAKIRYLELAGTNRVVRHYEKILEAAQNGRVATAFVAADRNQWQSGPKAGLREDIFDRIATETYLAQGEVFVIPEDKLPSGEGACAILRY